MKKQEKLSSRINRILKHCSYDANDSKVTVESVKKLEKRVDRLRQAVIDSRPCVEEIAEQVNCTAPHKAAPIYKLLQEIDALIQQDA